MKLKQSHIDDVVKSIVGNFCGNVDKAMGSLESATYQTIESRDAAS